MAEGLEQKPTRATGAKSLDGRLEIVAEHSDGAKGTIISHQYHSVPFHLSKTYWTGDVLLVQVVNPTAGIFAGDRMHSEVRVGKGARLLLTSPSASRAHTMAERDGGAFLFQSFEVAEGAWFELLPELFIPQRATSYRQKTEIAVEAGGSLYFVETMAPGRVAHGEAMAFRELDWSFSLRVAGRLVSRERAEIRPPDHCWMLAVAGWGTVYHASIWIVAGAGGPMSPDLAVEIEALTDQVTRLTGVTELAKGVHSIKILASSSIALRQTLRAVRSLLSDWLPGLANDPRKL